MDILINCISLKNEYGICPVERPDIPTSQQEIKTIDIEGRNGSLHQKGGWQDVEFKLTFNMLEEENIKKKARRIKAFLIQASKLSFSDEPDVFYKIKYIQTGDIANEVEEWGEFEVSFKIEPFAYYDFIPDIELLERTIIYNPGSFNSQPLIRVYGSGNGELIINKDKLIIKNLVEYIDLDSSMLEAFKESTSLNNKIVGNFPELIPGTNSISWTGGVTKIKIIPKWRDLL